MQISLVLASLLFILQKRASCYYELVEELSCYNNLFRLSCLPLNGQIVILEATFSNDDTLLAPLRTSCNLPGVPSNETGGGKQISFRHAVNKRCSGRNVCSFTLLEDHKDSLAWGPGMVYLRYACMDDTHIFRSCSAEINIDGEGFIQTPGYPGYYVGGHTCQWTFRAPPNRQVQLQFLDISLRGVGPLEKECKDWLLVTEYGLDILATCGEVSNTEIITSTGEEINVTLTTSSVNIFPKRGLLFHYKAMGCKIPEPPLDGYLVTKNDTIVHYRCNYAYNFPDTSHRDRIINCHDLHVSLPDCTYVGPNESDVASVFRMNITSEIFETTNSLSEVKASTMSDLIFPSVVISILLFGNLVIIGLIYFFKKRQETYGPDPWDSAAPQLKREQATIDSQMTLDY